MMIHIAGNNSKSTITNVSDKDVQPNAVDLKLSKVFRIVDSLFTINENQKIHRTTEELFPEMYERYKAWVLTPGQYEVVMDNHVEVGEGEAGYLIARSTLNRNGVFITSGLYDSGFKGALAGVMHVTAGPMVVEKGTRIAQFLLFKAESLHQYSGDYGLNSDGTPKDMEKKYA